MPNWCDLGKEFPSRADVEEMEYKQKQRNNALLHEERSVEEYLKKHPSASRAEALYFRDEKKSISKAGLRKFCRVCCKGGLYWSETEFGWRLFEKGSKHVCEN